MSHSSTQLVLKNWTPMKKEYRAVIITITILLLISNFLTFKFATTPYSYGLQHDVTEHNQNTQGKPQEKPTISQEPGTITSTSIAVEETTQQPASTSTLASTSTSTSAPTLTPTAIPFPAEYQQEVDAETGWCQDRFSKKYLTDLVHSRQQYCDAASGGSLYCYYISVGGDVGTDAFCVSSPAEFKRDQRKFVLKCNKDDSVQPTLNNLPSYWYGTGPRALLYNYLDMSPSASEPPGSPERRFSILVKREDALDNFWHVLMQIESVMLTLDVMSISVDHEGKPLYTAEDIKNTQIVITDTLQESIFGYLWEKIGGRPVRRLDELARDESSQSEHVIIPLAGKSNPMWQGDWSPHLCHHSELLQVFVDRILKQQGLQPSPRRDNDKALVFTWIDRKGSRKLIDQDQHINEIKEKFSNVEVRVVDFAALTLAEQLKAVQESDILAGVHGAGLTHGMFLGPGSTLIEIQPPELKHRGFRNMAHLMGVQYFTIHADGSEGSSDWHEAHVSLATSKFESVVETAIKAMSQSGLRTDDVA